MNNSAIYFSEKGLGIAVPFSVESVNQKYQNYFAGFQSGMLLGNSKYLWKVFIKNLSQMDSFSENPLDDYVEQICSSFSNLHKDVKIIFSHQKWQEDHYFPFQDFIHSLNIAGKTKTNLLFHPQFGYWFSLRAILLSPHLGFLSESSLEVGKDELSLSCAYACEHNCEKWYKKYEKSLSREDHIKFRQSCPHAKDYQFSDNQIKYHYFQDTDVLHEEIRSRDERL